MRNIRNLKVRLTDEQRSHAGWIGASKCEVIFGRVLKPSAGFTLLEIMVSISIIAIVLVAVYRMHTQTISMNTAVKFYTTAPLLAHGKIAELETTASNELTDDSGNFGEEFAGYRWNVSIEDVESKFLGAAGKDLKKIDVTISFNNDEFTYNLKKYRFVRDLGI